MKYKALSAQGTKIRVHAGVVNIATFAKAGADVTVTLAGHGMEIGDRFEVTEAEQSEAVLGRFSVKAATTNTFTFAAAGEDVVPAGSDMKLVKLLDVACKTFTFGGSASVQDTSTLSSVAKEKRKGLKDNGQLTFSIYPNMKNPAHRVLVKACESPDSLPVEIAYPDGTYFGLDYLVITFPQTGGVDGMIETAVNGEIDGAIVEYSDAA